jgi:hypothetical protein
MIKRLYLLLSLNLLVFNSHGQITGPTSVCTGDIVTFSQNAAYGADYFWAVSKGASLSDPWINKTLCNINGSDSDFNCYEDPL